MTVSALQHISKMRGQTKSHLMYADDGHLYVVKFQNNPQGLRVLANEYFATRLACACGFTVAESETIKVIDFIVQSIPELAVDLESAKRRCRSDLHFGSQLVGGNGPGHLWDYLPGEYFLRVSNLADFPGMLAFDQWCGNADRRQAVYWNFKKGTPHEATFIDYGSCFDSKILGNHTGSSLSLFGRDEAYIGVTGWHSFEPWLSNIENLPAELIWELALEVPNEWWGPERGAREQLVETLIARRWRIRQLITQVRDCPRKPFPFWIERMARQSSMVNIKQSSPSIYPWQAIGLSVM
jgi:hypothetical protein